MFLQKEHLHFKRYAFGPLYHSKSALRVYLVITSMIPKRVRSLFADMLIKNEDKNLYENLSHQVIFTCFGGTSHTLDPTNRLASEMDGAAEAA